VESKRATRRGRTDPRLGFESPQDGDQATHELTQSPKTIMGLLLDFHKQTAISADSASQPRRTTRCAEVMTGETQNVSEYLHIPGEREEMAKQSQARRPSLNSNGLWTFSLMAKSRPTKPRWIKIYQTENGQDYHGNGHYD
jgi:hypothetical protein